MTTPAAIYLQGQSDPRRHGVAKYAELGFDAAGRPTPIGASVVPMACCLGDRDIKIGSGVGLLDPQPARWRRR
jgi:hypothetical protein